MQRAGLSVARLALATFPHACNIWIACGPGNNGGDGYEAARHLKLWGKTTVVTEANPSAALTPDSTASRQSALEAGVVFSDHPPEQFDLCIDALFGIGCRGPLDAPYAQWICTMNSRAAPVLSVDTPSGLNADSGVAQALCVRANVTLSLLTLKPGLFTADGRATCGDIWFDALDVAEPKDLCAELNRSPPHMIRAHNTHKGSFGDVCVVGGSRGMAGAAMLASEAALRGGAGRVYLALLDKTLQPLHTYCPEVMFRDLSTIAYDSTTIVAGCGGGDEIIAHLPELVDRSARLVLDADALNGIAKSTSLQQQLAARKPNTTVLTPHPLEAARLVNESSVYVQANRIAVAQTLADRFGCVVVLKGSGTIITAPRELPRINTSGNARLATAGTGDVLAGLVGARLAAGANAFFSACDSVFLHGCIADIWESKTTLTARELTKRLSV